MEGQLRGDLASTWGRLLYLLPSPFLLLPVPQNQGIHTPQEEGLSQQEGLLGLFNDL